MHENLQTPQATSHSSTLVPCNCNHVCRKRKRTLDLMLPKPLREEALCRIRVGPSYKKRHRIPEEVDEIALDEDFEAEFVHPLDFDIWLWKNGFNLKVLLSLTPEMGPCISTRERIKTVKENLGIYYDRYRLICRE